MSTSDQNNRSQIDRLTEFGVEPAAIFQDKASGKNMQRPGWKHCWKELRDGDVLVVTAIDRLGRDLVEVVQTVKALHDKGVDLKILSMDLDTRTATGRLIFAIIAAMAQWERELIAERTDLNALLAKADNYADANGFSPKAREENRRHAAIIHQGMWLQDHGWAWLWTKPQGRIGSRSGAQVHG